MILLEWCGKNLLSFVALFSEYFSFPLLVSSSQTRRFFSRIGAVPGV